MMQKEKEYLDFMVCYCNMRILQSEFSSLCDCVSRPHTGLKQNFLKTEEDANLKPCHQKDLLGYGL